MFVLMQYNIIIFVVGWIKLFRLLWSRSVMFIGKKLLITDSQFSLTWIKKKWDISFCSTKLHQPQIIQIWMLEGIYDYSIQSLGG